MTKNRKSFLAVIQPKDKQARVYRIKKNEPELIGFMQHIRINTVDKRDKDIVWFLKYNGYVLSNHSVGNEFILNVV